MFNKVASHITSTNFNGTFNTPNIPPTQYPGKSFQITNNASFWTQLIHADRRSVKLLESDGKHFVRLRVKWVLSAFGTKQNGGLQDILKTPSALSRTARGCNVTDTITEVHWTALIRWHCWEIVLLIAVTRPRIEVSITVQTTILHWLFRGLVLFKDFGQNVVIIEPTNLPTSSKSGD